MDIKTKFYSLNKNIYIKLSLINILKKQWPIGALIIIVTLLISFLYHNFYLNIYSISLVVGYVFCRFLLLYIITKLKTTQMLFTRYFYCFSQDNILMMAQENKGMPIPWENIQSFKEDKRGFIFFLSTNQLIYIPFDIFKTSIDISRLRILLKNKGYLF